MPAVSSSMRIGDPVAVRSMIARSWASSAARLASLRSDLIDLYMCAAARFTVHVVGVVAGQLVERRQHPEGRLEVGGVDAAVGAARSPAKRTGRGPVTGIR